MCDEGYLLKSHFRACFIFNAHELLNELEALIIRPSGHNLLIRFPFVVLEFFSFSSEVTSQVLQLSFGLVHWGNTECWSLMVVGCRLFHKGAGDGLAGQDGGLVVIVSWSACHTIIDKRLTH